MEELVVYTRKLSCDLLTKIKVSALRNEGRGRILNLKNAVLALFLSLSCLSFTCKCYCSGVSELLDAAG